MFLENEIKVWMNWSPAETITHGNEQFKNV